MIRIECSIRAWTMRGMSMIGRNSIVNTVVMVVGIYCWHLSFDLVGNSGSSNSTLSF